MAGTAFRDGRACCASSRRTRRCAYGTDRRVLWLFRARRDRRDLSRLGLFALRPGRTAPRYPGPARRPSVTPIIGADHGADAATDRHHGQCLAAAGAARQCLRGIAAPDLAGSADRPDGDRRTPRGLRLSTGRDGERARRIRAARWHHRLLPTAVARALAARLLRRRTREHKMLRPDLAADQRRSRERRDRTGRRGVSHRGDDRAVPRRLPGGLRRWPRRPTL